MCFTIMFFVFWLFFFFRKRKVTLAWKVNYIHNVFNQTP